MQTQFFRDFLLKFSLPTLCRREVAHSAFPFSDLQQGGKSLALFDSPLIQILAQMKMCRKGEEKIGSKEETRGNAEPRVMKNYEK